MNKLPRRFKLSRAKAYPIGLKIVRCDRTSILGNPFKNDMDLKAYEAWIRHSVTPLPVLTSTGKIRMFCPVKARQRLKELAVNPPTHLACWCATDASNCHLTVILKLLAEMQDD